MELVEKLIERYTFFTQFETKKKMARYAFSLLIRVIDEIEYETNICPSRSIFHPFQQ